MCEGDAPGNMIGSPLFYKEGLRHLENYLKEGGKRFSYKVNHSFNEEAIF